MSTREPRPFAIKTRDSAAMAYREQLRQAHASAIASGARVGVGTAWEWCPREALAALDDRGDHLTAADVEALRPSVSPTWTECGHCGAENVPVVVLGEEPSWDSSTADVCADCLREALAAITARP